jgi:membrane-bound metal-dependent hydrolase YbcI (DUF457 family)
MFIGHYAVALAAKKAATQTSLGTLFIGAQFIDHLWPVFLLLGWEHVRIDPGNTAMTPLDFYDYPLSHSLAGNIVWAALLGGLYVLLRRDARGAIVLAGCVVSHWILDAITHRPDLPLWFSGDVRIGLGLWNAPLWSFVAESALYGTGIWVYLRTTEARDRIGTYGFWGLIVLLAVIHVGNLFGPPPPDTAMIAVAGNAGWLFVLWAFWIDTHRKVRGTEGEAVQRSVHPAGRAHP